MSLMEVVKVVFKRRYIVLLFVLLALFAGVVVNYTILDPRYEATAVVVVEAPEYGVVDMGGMVRMVKSRMLMRRAAELLKKHVVKPDAAGEHPAGEKQGAFDVDKLARELTASVILMTDAESGEVSITFANPDAKTSAAYANAVAGAFDERIKEEATPAGERARVLLGKAQALQSELQAAREQGEMQDVSVGARLDREMEVARGAVNLVETGACSISDSGVMVKDVVKAVPPAEPVRPKRERNVALFCLCGLVVGVLVALRLEKGRSEKIGIANAHQG